MRYVAAEVHTVPYAMSLPGSMIQPERPCLEVGDMVQSHTTLQTVRQTACYTKAINLTNYLFDKKACGCTSCLFNRKPGHDMLPLNTGQKSEITVPHHVFAAQMEIQCWQVGPIQVQCYAGCDYKLADTNLTLPRLSSQERMQVRKMWLPRDGLEHRLCF